MKAIIKSHAMDIYGLSVAQATATLEPGRSVNYEILAALSIEAAMEFEHKCEQEEQDGRVSRIVKLKRAHREGVGMFLRGEDAPAPGSDEFSKESLNGWRWACAEEAKRNKEDEQRA